MARMITTKAAFLGAPLLLSGCVTAIPEPARIVIEIPGKSVQISEPLVEKNAKMEKKSHAILNISVSGNTIEARLSVIRPDDSLDRVILDPDVTFFYQNDSGKWEAVPGCLQTPSCDFSSLMGGKERLIFKASYAAAHGNFAHTSSEIAAWGRVPE